jgi:DNA-binding NtrC family response regulator
MSQILLSVSPCGEDHNALRRILSSTRWQIAAVNTCRRAISLLGHTHVSVIVCEHELPDGTWQDILSLFADSRMPPRVIVTSKVANEHLWAEVLNLGGYDVLAKPFREQEVRHVLTSAGSGKAQPLLG